MRKWLLIALAALIAIPLVLLGILLYTPSGVSLLAGQTHRLEQAGITLAGISGRLAGPLYIERLEIDTSGVHIVSHDIVIRPRLRDLIMQTIHVRSLTARDTLVELRASTTPPSDAPPRLLPRYLNIDIRSAGLAGLRIVTAAGSALDLTRVNGNVRIGPDWLNIRSVEVTAPQFDLTGKGRLLARRPLGLELQLGGTLRPPRGPPLEVRAQTSGDLERLAIQAKLLQPDVIDVDALLTRPDDAWRIQGKVAAPAVSLAPWLEQPPFSLRNVALDVDADAQRIHLAGNIGLPEIIERDLTIDIGGIYAARTLRLDAATIAVNDTPLRLQAAGTVGFETDMPALDMQASWSGLQWPLLGEAQARSPDGTLTLRGSLPYAYTLSAAFALPLALPGSDSEVLEGTAVARGSINKERIGIDDYTLNVLRGNVTGNGSFAFAPPRAWTLIARARDIDTAPLHREFPGTVSVNVDARGQTVADQMAFTARIADLGGTLRGARLSGGGVIERSQPGWRFGNVRLNAGDASAFLDGTLRDSVNLRWSLQANSLQSLLRDAQGRIRLAGTARGPARTPRIVANGEAHELQYAQWRVDRVSFDADVDMQDRQPSRLSLDASDIGRADVFVQSLLIDGKGLMREHRFDVAIVGNGDSAQPAPHMKLLINGSHVAQVWRGTAQATQISDGRKTDEPLSMPRPASILASRDRFTLDDLCIALYRGQVCGEGRWQRNGPWEGTVSGYEIPLAALLPPAGPQTEFSGRIEGRVHASGAPDRPWLLDAGARIIDAALVYKPTRGEPEVLQLGNGGLAATATAEQIDFSLGVQAFHDTFVHANAHIARRGSNDVLNLPLVGEVQARAADVNILPLLFSEVDDAAGLLTADLQVRGTLARPELGGRIELHDGQLDSFRANLALRQLNALIEIADNALQLKGSGVMGEGKAVLDGRFHWQQRQMHGELSLTGDHLLIADLPEYRIVASPDLKFRLAAQRLDVSGDVIITEGRIQPDSMRNAVTRSPDARYTDESEAERAGRLHVTSNVHVRMGDDVRVNSFGLQGQIVGAVDTSIQTGATPTGRGELAISSGRYEAFGQSLAIDRGRLLFNNSPLDDPVLDIEARRRIQDVLVGLTVRGTLREPRLSFFSDPSMSQASIVSFLLVGRSVDTMQRGDVATMAQARDALAQQGGNLLAAQIGRRIGLEGMGIESSVDAAGNRDTALVLGKFLTPRLFISYGISLTESINTVKLRYTLSDSWIVKMEAGTIQSIDAEFSIDR